MTPRDRLQRLGDLAKRVLHQWWLIALLTVIGGGLALAFAVLRTQTYVSWSTLFYQEQIQSQLMTPNREEIAQRNIGDRFRELLLARGQLEQIVADPTLNPFPDETDHELAVDKLREAVTFEPRGTNAFRVTFKDSDRDRARAVTERLTRLLQQKDEELRNEQATATVKFATEQKEGAATELRQSEQALAEFLARHPEFAQDANQVNAEGASIRAIRDQKAVKDTGNTRLYALERQRQRIQARLDAPPDAPPIRIATPSTPERVAAEAMASEARREVTAATRELEDALSRYTDKHPAVFKAQARVAAAQQRLRGAEAAVPPAMETQMAPATPADRAKLERELDHLGTQITAEQKRTGKEPASSDATTNWVVKLETEHADLRRVVNEHRERVEGLAASVFRAQIDANQKLAEVGGRLSIIDPAFRPVRPSGPGKTIYLLAGMLLFLTIGLTLAGGLALIDDRVYRRADLDEHSIPVLGVIPPARGAGTKPRKPTTPRRRTPRDPDQATHAHG